MAGWNDLPKEIQLQVVELVDYGGKVRKGNPEKSPQAREVRRTLFSLSQVDRRSYALLGPRLWQIIVLGRRSSSDAEFLRSVGAEQRSWVRKMCYGGQPMFTRDQSSLEAYQEIAQSLPNLHELIMVGCPEVWLPRLHSLPGLKASLDTVTITPERRLKVDDGQDVVESATIALAAALSALPQLKSLTVRTRSSPTALVLKADSVFNILQSLPNLQYLSIDPLYDLSNSTLRRAWNSSLTQVHLSLYLDTSQLQALFGAIGTTLLTLKLESPPRRSRDDPAILAPFHLPSLLRLTLRDFDPTASSILDGFTSAPLQSASFSLAVCSDPAARFGRTVQDGEEKADFDDIWSFVKRHRASMDWLELRVWKRCYDLELVEELRVNCQALLGIEVRVRKS